MFNKNLEAIEKKNPKLAKELKNYSIDDVKDIEVFEAESKDIILSYKGCLLHSGEDPIREAKSTWHKAVSEDLKPNDIQLIYGLGLGYLFKRAYTNAESKIIIYEPSLDVLRFVLEYVDFSQELDDKRVFLFHSKEDLYEGFTKSFLSGDKVEVLFLPAYLGLGKDELISISEKVYSIVKDKTIDQTTVAITSRFFVNNLLKRIHNLEKFQAVDFLEGEGKGKPALILSAGPSLKDNIELLKENKDKFITIAILPVVEFLIENGVEPDFVTVADPWNQQRKITKVKGKLKNTNFVIEARSDISLDELNTNSKFIYYSNVDKISTKLIEQSPQTNITTRNATPSVALLSYELAKILKCEDVTFIGLDLAILDNKAYAQGAKATFEGENKLILTDEAGSKTRYLTKVKSADGNEVLTREDYLIFIKEFAKLTNEFDALKMYNTSLNGALIEGMEYKSFKDIADKKEITELNINEKIRTIINENKQKWSDFILSTQKVIDDEKKSIIDSLPTIKKAIKATEDILDILKSDSPDLENFQKIFNENLENFSKSRHLITNGVVLSSNMQKHIMKYLKKYNRTEEINIQILTSNFEADLELFNCAIKSASDIISLIEAK